MIALPTRYYGWALIVGLSIAPIVLWFLAPAGIPRFSSFESSMANIGQLLGLVGVSLFALNLILSARLHVLEKYFNGLNKVYERHGQIGQVALMMLLFHPLFLLFIYADSLSSAAIFLLPSANWPQNFGIFALAIMLSLIVITLYLRPRYHIWKVTHKFLGGAFFLASLHVFLIPSDTSIFMPLRVYILGLVAFGLLAFSYRTLFGRLFVKRYVYVVSKVVSKNRDICEITMMPQEDMMSFTPGQFIFVSFMDGTMSREAHPFSITSSTHGNSLTIAVKKSGDYTNRITGVAVGNVVYIEGPFGVFSYTQGAHKKQIWIAGGIGITPFLAMVRSLRKEAGYTVDLYYCVKNEQEAVYANEIQTTGSLVRMIPFYSDSKGYINTAFIEKESGELSKKDIFICAPQPMIQSLRSQFINAGVGKRSIYSEEFSI